MGGRVYDPILGRFLQADPFVQQPNNIQNFNRYSYVLNNPLNKTDPSGYFFQILVVWAVQYVAAATATTAIGAALSAALTAYSYYGYAQMAIGAVKAIEGGGTAMANFAGGMAKGYAKGAIFQGVMGDATELGKAHAAGKTAAKPVDNKPGSTQTDSYEPKEPEDISNRVITNGDLIDKGKVTVDGKNLNIRFNVFNNSNDSGLSDEHVLSELTKFSEGMSGNVNKGGKLTVSFSMVDSPGQADLIVARCDNLCISRFEKSKGKNFANVAAFQQGENIRFNQSGYDINRQTLQHELGHYLGLQHQSNAKGDDIGSIMSYSNYRAILGSDRQRVYDGYFYTVRDLRK